MIQVEQRTKRGQPQLILSVCVQWICSLHMRTSRSLPQERPGKLLLACSNIAKNSLVGWLQDEIKCQYLVWLACMFDILLFLFLLSEWKEMWGHDAESFSGMDLSEIWGLSWVRCSIFSALHAHPPCWLLQWLGSVNYITLRTNRGVWNSCPMTF